MDATGFVCGYHFIRLNGTSLVKSLCSGARLRTWAEILSPNLPFRGQKVPS